MHTPHVCLFVQWCTFPSSPVINRLKPQRPIVPTPSWPWSIEITLSVVSCPTVFVMPRTNLQLFFHRIQASGKRNRGVEMRFRTAGASCFGRSKPPRIVHGQSTLCFLHAYESWTETRFMIRNHSTAAVPGLTVSDVNFNFSCIVYNNGFRFLQVWCPTVFASSGHRVLLKSGLQDTVVGWFDSSFACLNWEKHSHCSQSAQKFYFFLNLWGCYFKISFNSAVWRLSYEEYNYSLSVPSHSRSIKRKMLEIISRTSCTSPVGASRHPASLFMNVYNHILFSSKVFRYRSL